MPRHHRMESKTSPPEKRDGHDEITGRFLPGNKGGGRLAKPKGFFAFRTLCQQMAEKPQGGAEKLFRLALRPGEAQKWALPLLLEYAYGKPQSILDASNQSSLITQDVRMFTVILQAPDGQRMDMLEWLRQFMPARAEGVKAESLEES